MEFHSARLHWGADQPGQLEILLGNLHPDQECLQAAVGISINEDQQYEGMIAALPCMHSGLQKVYLWHDGSHDGIRLLSV